MAAGKFQLRRAIILAYLIAVHFVAGYFLFKEIRAYLADPVSVNRVQDPIVPSPVPTPIPVPSQLADLSTDPSPTDVGLDLTVPVAGVAVDQLIDSYEDARGEGRSHDAIDIPAPDGTPVIAAADGTIARFFDSVPGGITIYQFTDDKRYMLYYAHLQRRADGLKAGDRVERGQTIGYVGNTGNAGPGNFHLHFSVALITDPTRYWEGEYMNPFLLFRRSAP